jgi:hypothetical protein
MKFTAAAQRGPAVLLLSRFAARGAKQFKDLAKRRWLRVLIKVRRRYGPVANTI